jgi:hypothetical protein
MENAQTSDPVLTAAKQIDRYWYQDGINEIGRGIGMLGGGAVAYMVHTEMATGKAAWSAVAIGFAGVALGFSEGKVKKLLRERFSYPRIGYLSEKGGEPLSRRRKIAIAVTMSILLLIPLATILMLRGHREPPRDLFGWMRWFPFAAGPFFMGAAVVDYERFKLPRLLMVGFLGMITGLAVSIFIDAAFLPWAVFALVYGIIVIASGTSALVSLVRTTPAEVE